jgi:hypothetical protein
MISSGLWIQIRMDPHHFGNMDPHQDPHPHQINIRIRIRIRISDKLGPEPEPDPHHFQMTSQNVWNMSLFVNFFKGLSLYLEAKIWIRIRIRVINRNRIRIWITLDFIKGFQSYLSKLKNIAKFR